MTEATGSGGKTAAKDADIAAATDRAAAEVSTAVEHAGDNTPTRPGTEAAKAAAGTNETRSDAARKPEAA